MSLVVLNGWQAWGLFLAGWLLIAIPLAIFIGRYLAERDRWGPHE